MILAYILRNTDTSDYLLEMDNGGAITTPELEDAKLFYTEAIADSTAKYLGNNWAKEEYWLMSMPDAKRTKDWKQELKDLSQTHFDIEASKKQKHPELYGNYGC